MSKKEIRGFFDVLSIDRDTRMSRIPLIKYEATMRQHAVFELLAPHPNELILDVGAGNARDIRFLTQIGCQSIGIDLSAGMLVDGKKVLDNLGTLGAAQLIMADALTLPFPSETFDKIICSEVIEHIPDWQQAIAEMSRVLRRGGLLVITTPNKYGIYGVWQTLLKPAITALKQLRRELVHPYDEWKVQKDVIKTLEVNNCITVDRLGVCFYPLPAVISYRFPKPLAELSIAIVRRAEPYLQRPLHKFGYMMALAAKKV